MLCIVPLGGIDEGLNVIKLLNTVRYRSGLEWGIRLIEQGMRPFRFYRTRTLRQ